MTLSFKKGCEWASDLNIEEAIEVPLFPLFFWLPSANEGNSSLSHVLPPRYSKHLQTQGNGANHGHKLLQTMRQNRLFFLR